MHLHRTFAITLAVAWATVPSDVFACGRSPDPCAPLVLGGVEASIPANTPQLPLTGRKGLNETDIALFAGDAGDAQPVQGWHLTRDRSDWPQALVFDRELTPGTSYKLVVAGCSAPQEMVFQVGPSVPFPSSLGSLEVAFERRHELLFDTSRCANVDVDVLVAKLSLAWSDEARPWRNLLEWQTLVDGAPLSYPAARGRDLLVFCGGDFFSLLREGERSVAVRAVLPGRDEQLQTRAVAMSLRCNEPELAPADANTSLPDAGAPSTAAPISTNSAEREDTELGAERGCRIGTGRVDDAFGSLALLLAYLASRRARRHA